MVIEREEATVGKQGLPHLSDESAHSSRPTDNLALAYTQEKGSRYELKVPELNTFPQQEIENRVPAMHLNATQTGSLNKASQSTYWHRCKPDS